MADMDVTTRSLSEWLALYDPAPAGELPIDIKYGSMEAKLILKVKGIELEPDGQRVVIIVE